MTVSCAPSPAQYHHYTRKVVHMENEATHIMKAPHKCMAKSTQNRMPWVSWPVTRKMLHLVQGLSFDLFGPGPLGIEFLNMLTTPHQNAPESDWDPLEVVWPFFQEAWQQLCPLVHLNPHLEGLPAYLLFGGHQGPPTAGIGETPIAHCAGVSPSVVRSTLQS